MMLKRVKSFFGRIRDSWPRGRRWKTLTMDDEPTNLLPNTVYLIGAQTPWAAVFVCPCGCQKVVWLNLLRGHRPRWSVSVSERGVPTVSPSVNRHVGCKSHFFLRSGRIVWCGRRRHLWFL